MRLVRGPVAEHEGRALDRPSVGGARDRASGGHRLQLHARDHVGISAQPVRLKPDRVRRLPAGREDDGADHRLDDGTVVPNQNGKVAGLAGDLGYLSGGENSDGGQRFSLPDERVDLHRLQIPVGRTLGELPAESGSVSTQLWALFDEHHVKAGPGRVDGGGEPCDAAAYYQDRPRVGLRVRSRWGRLLRADNSHSQVVLGQALGFGMVGRVAPHHLLPDVDPLDERAFDAEHIGVDPRGTGGDHDGIDPLLLDVVLDQPRVLQAKGGRGPHNRDPELGRGRINQLLPVEASTYAAAAAEVDADLFPHHPASADRRAAL